jgi:hypothetical protein
MADARNEHNTWGVVLRTHSEDFWGQELCEEEGPDVAIWLSRFSGVSLNCLTMAAALWIKTWAG